MKKRTRLSLSLVIVFFISSVIFSPIFFHKTKSIEPNTVVAYDNKPTPAPKQKLNPSVPSDPFSKNKSIKQITNASTVKPEPIFGSNVQQPNPHIYPAIKPQIKKEKLGNEGAFLAKDNPVDKQLISSKQDVNESGKSSPSEKLKSMKHSKWGAVIMVNPSNVDAGLTYRLAELSFLKESDLDIVMGLKEAGLGLSKNVYKKLGLGFIGTIGYEDGDKRLGVYVKYTF
jgi:hypothetical protein